MGNRDGDTTLIKTRYEPPPEAMPAERLLITVMFVVCAVLVVVGTIIGHPEHGPALVPYPVALGVSMAGAWLVAITYTWGTWKVLRTRSEHLAQLRAVTLPERARHAAEVLQQATMLMEELQAELTARTALLEDVKRQAGQAAKRAADMEKLSSVDDETTRILNTYFDEALKHRLEVLERASQQREWFIGTIVAGAVGILAILLAHYFLGF